MKSKSLRFNPHIHQSGHNGLKLLSFGLGIAATYYGSNVFYCGNPACGRSISFTSRQKRPKGCKACGALVDWVGTFTKMIKRCPMCKKDFSKYDRFCDQDVVLLVDAEVPM